LDNVLNDALDTADFPSGYSFGNYVIRERIGRGGMARVYRAEHVALNKLVALKVMDDNALQDRAAGHRRFLREGRAAAAVKHPNVVDIADVGVWQGIPYLVMELLEGHDLETYLRERGPLLDTELARLALPIIAGLAVAHDAGVVHRDLKPSNIFMARSADGDLMPKVLDFGISKFAPAMPQPDMLATPYGEVMGTPVYLPPEGLDGSRDLTTLSDQYSLGVVLYECAVGQPPLQGDTLVSLLQRIAAGDYEPPSNFRPDISAGVERAIMRAMSLNPADRYPHVREFGRALWEVASPRTQLLWGRSFGTGDGDARSVAPRPGLRVSRLAGLGSGSTESAVTRSKVSTRRVSSPTFARRKALRVTVACAVAGVAVAGVIAYRAASSGPQPAPAASGHTLAPVEAQVETAALEPSVAPAAAAPRVSLSEPERHGVVVGHDVALGKSRVRAVESDSTGDARKSNGRRSSSGRRAQASRPAARTHATAAPSPAPRESNAGVDDEEFPGLSRGSEPRGPARAADHDSSLGANASPLLD
jgi:eukaryotic-like serine/threonine-protein kinase